MSYKTCENHVSFTIALPYGTKVAVNILFYSILVNYPYSFLIITYILLETPLY